MGLCGVGEDHCCYLGKAGVCQYVRSVGQAPFKWQCSLRSEMASWAEVHDSDKYRSGVKPKLIACNIKQDCGDWPPPGTNCNNCGLEG